MRVTTLNDSNAMQCAFSIFPHFSQKPVSRCRISHFIPENMTTITTRADEFKRISSRCLDVISTHTHFSQANKVQSHSVPICVIECCAGDRQTGT